VGTDLAGATLGVVGLGHLGRRVAAIGQAFGMRVIARRDPTERPAQAEVQSSQDMDVY
jgi:phosphoglycerate dehydrogenase-like enzyme